MNYIAIDFETAYWGPANACSLGIVTSDGEKSSTSGTISSTPSP